MSRTRAVAVADRCDADLGLLVEVVSARHPRPTVALPPFQAMLFGGWSLCAASTRGRALRPSSWRAEPRHPELTRIHPVLWVITRHYLVLPICLSNRPSLGHWTPFQLAPMSLCHTPLVAFSSLSTSLLFCTTRWSRLDSYVSCRSPRISHCSKEPWYLLWRWGWKPGPGCPTCVSLLGWETKGKHMCKYMWLRAHTLP